MLVHCDDSQVEQTQIVIRLDLQLLFECSTCLRVRSLLQLNEVCVPEIVVCPRKLWIDRNGFIKLANGELQEAGLAIGAAEKHMQRSRRALKRQNTIE